MEQILLVGLVLLTVSLAVALIFVLSKSRKENNNTGVELLKADITELSRNMSSLQNVLGDKLERSTTVLNSSLQKQLGESMKIVSDVSQRLTKLDETNRRVVDVADELKTLQNVLQNPKQRGVFGEYYLESVLSNILPSKNFQMQYKFKNGNMADAVVFLDKGRILPVDSKFSLENYNRMVAATATSYVAASAIINPAVAISLQALSWEVWPLVVYVLAPALGGIVGFVLYDVLNGRKA